MATTYNNLYLDIRQQLRRAGIEEATLEARELVCFGTNKSREELARDGGLYASPELEHRVRDLVRRHLEGEPVAYLIGEWEFYGLPLDISRDVLIPRPETAELVELIVEENPNARRLLDIGTGSGCIAISLDKKLPDAEVEAWDISEEALAIARKNNDALEARVRFLQRDVLADDWEKIPSFDVIVSNPPYVTETEKNEMDANVLDWEPGLALFVPDEDPLRFYNRIARLGSELLLPGGKLYFEINQAYGRETAHILEMNQYRDVRVIRDIFGKDRIVTANR